MSGPPLSEISIAMYPEFKLYSGQNRHDLYTLRVQKYPSQVKKAV